MLVLALVRALMRIRAHLLNAYFYAYAYSYLDACVCVFTALLHGDAEARRFRRARDEALQRSLRAARERRLSGAAAAKRKAGESGRG